MRKRNINIKLGAIGLEKLKNYLRIRRLKVNRKKNELVARVFAASENGVKPIKNVVEIEADLKTEHLAKLKIDDKNISDHLKRAQRALKLRSL